MLSAQSHGSRLNNQCAKKMQKKRENGNLICLAAAAAVQFHFKVKRRFDIAPAELASQQTKKSKNKERSRPQCGLRLRQLLTPAKEIHSKEERTAANTKRWATNTERKTGEDICNSVVFVFISASQPGGHPTDAKQHLNFPLAHSFFIKRTQSKKAIGEAGEAGKAGGGGGKVEFNNNKNLNYFCQSLPPRAGPRVPGCWLMVEGAKVKSKIYNLNENNQISSPSTLVKRKNNRGNSGHGRNGRKRGDPETGKLINFRSSSSTGTVHKCFFFSPADR